MQYLRQCYPRVDRAGFKEGGEGRKGCIQCFVRSSVLSHSLCYSTFVTPAFAYRSFAALSE